MFRSGAFCRSEFQLGEHLEGNENFAWGMLEKFFPHMVGAATKAGDEDIGIDETGHLRPGIEGLHGGRKGALWSTERRIADRTEGRHPFGGVGAGTSIRIGR